jgi:hypothetical protein
VAGIGPKGLFADVPGDYNFYGTRSELSGENTGFAAAEIIVRPGNTLSGGFLTMSGSGTDVVTTANETVTVSNIGWNSALWGLFPSGRQGYVNWKR